MNGRVYDQSLGLFISADPKAPLDASAHVEPSFATATTTSIPTALELPEVFGYSANRRPSLIEAIPIPALGLIDATALAPSRMSGTQRFNRFAYVEGRVLTLTDPTGFYPACDLFCTPIDYQRVFQLDGSGSGGGGGSGGPGGGGAGWDSNYYPGGITVGAGEITGGGLAIATGLAIGGPIGGGIALIGSFFVGFGYGTIINANINGRRPPPRRDPRP